MKQDSNFQAVETSAVRGGALMCLAMLCFVLNDTAVKTLAGSMTVGQLIAVRGLFACLIIGGLVVVMGKVQDLHHMFSAHVLSRSFFDVLSTFLFITALFHMPLPNVTAILQAVPLLVTIMAALFLGEAVGWRRMSAIAAGFAGVLLIVKPGGQGFDAYVLLALACVVTVALRDLATRRLGRSVPSIVVAFANAIWVSVAGAVWALATGFSPMSAGQTGTLVLASAFLVGGYLFTVMSLRSADIAYTAPFRYSVIVFALILGYVVFGDVPDIWALAGIALVVGSGLFTLYREQRLKQRIGFGRRLIR